MDTLKYRALLYAVDTGSFRAAAEKLGYTTAGIFNMVNSVEGELGVAILNRGHFGVELSSSGEELIRHIREVVRMDDLLKGRALDMTGLVTGRVSIGAYFSISAHFLPEIFSRFHRDFPGVEIDLHEGGYQSLESMRKESLVDLCISASGDCKDADWIPLFDDEMFAVVPPEHPLADAESVSLEDVRIDATSGEVNIPALQAEELTLKVTSGDIQARVNARKITGKLTSGRMELQAMEEAKEISLSATSGDIILEAAGAEKIGINITSGSIRAAVKKAGEIKLSSTSGDVQAVIGEAKKADIGCTSGKITVDIARWDKLDVHATSGDIKAMLAAEPGFTARIDTTSGKLESKLAMAQNGKDYICGDGSAQVKLHTTSGNITVASQKK